MKKTKENITDKTNLSDRLKDLQKDKGTYDSPCMSVCNYKNGKCQTCKMLTEEKKKWKENPTNHKVKEEILSNVLKRWNN